MTSSGRGVGGSSKPERATAVGSSPHGGSERSPGKWETVATGLGWFSLALGGAQLLAPGRLNRLAGFKDTDGTRALQRLVGARELAAAAGLLGPARAAGWLWARAAGDVMDIALTASALRSRRSRRGRVAAIVAGLTGVAAVDAVAARRHARATMAGTTAKADTPFRARTAITINRPVEEAYGFWRDFENLPRFMSHLESVSASDGRRSHWVARGPAGKKVEWDAEIVEDRPNEVIAWRSVGDATVENRGSVRFRAAPGGRGTEVIVELEYTPPAGALGVAVAKLFGDEPLQQVRDDLRRFKQVIETGEVVRSDGSPDGTRSQRQWHQHEGQPLG